MRPTIITLSNGDKISSLDWYTETFVTIFKYSSVTFLALSVATKLFTGSYIFVIIYFIKWYLFLKFSTKMLHEPGILSRIIDSFQEKMTEYINKEKIKLIVAESESKYGKKLEIVCECSSNPNAPLGYLGTKQDCLGDIEYFIGMSQSLLREYTVPENAYVVLHEYAHYNHDDCRKKVILFHIGIMLAAWNLYFLLGIIPFYFYLSRRMEYAADHVAAVVAGKEHALSSLRKMENETLYQIKQLSTVNTVYYKLCDIFFLRTHPKEKRRIKFIENL